jgi:hypothetical protein
MINDLLNPWRSDLENASNKAILVVDEFGQISQVWRESFAGEPVWWVKGSGRWISDKTPTHWRYLPAMPNDPTAEKLLAVLRAAVAWVKARERGGGSLWLRADELERVIKALPQTLLDELKGGK